MPAPRAAAALLSAAAAAAAAEAPVAVCEDLDNTCGTWAAAGECSKNPTFMKEHCSEACKFCETAPQLDPDDPLLSKERAVLQTQFGEIVLGFYPTVAPVTVAHITKLVRLGGYNSNHIFRVDRGFVAQIQSVDHRQARMSGLLRDEAAKNVPDEFSKLKHTRGMLSMGKFDAPNTGGSSFSMLLGDAPSLDGRYTIFGRVVRGDHVLSRLEKVETKREGIFVMPKERIAIASAVMMYAAPDGGLALEAPAAATAAPPRDTTPAPAPDTPAPDGASAQRRVRGAAAGGSGGGGGDGCPDDAERWVWLAAGAAGGALAAAAFLRRPARTAAKAV